MTSGPLPVGFDEVRAGPGERLAVQLWPGNAERPVWTYWFPQLCWLFPAVLRAVPATGPDRWRGRFVYPVELRFEADEWSADAGTDLIALLPPDVERAASERRALIVVSIAHEGRPLFRPGAAAPLLDRVAAFGRWYGLTADELWLLAGNLDAAAEADAWRAHRGLARLPFTVRACEPFSAFVGGCARESLLRGRAPAAEVRFARRGAHAIGWRGTEVGWTAAPFPGLAGEAAAEPARFRYACLNRMFRPHRWHVLTRLWREGLLGDGLVSFTRPGPDELAGYGIDATAERELLGLLPLLVDRPHDFGDAAFFAGNSAYVALHPPAVLRHCALQLVTETVQADCRFVSEKTFKALLGRGPAAVVGTRGVLRYLRSLGARTWPDELDESYDEVAGDGARLAAALDSAVEFARRPGWANVDTRSVRADNLRWLTDSRKPWDTLAGELARALAG